MKLKWPLEILKTGGFLVVLSLTNYSILILSLSTNFFIVTFMIELIF